MDDSNLIETSKTFWENTYRQNINKMIGVSYRYTVDRQIAEDLAHDAFMIAYEKASSFEGKGPFEAWLRRIAVNVSLQYIRKQNKKKYMGDWLQNETGTVEMEEENLKKEQLDFTENELLEIINQLPEHHKLVFNLYVIDQFTHAQIGKELGISEGTSKSHLARARKKIKDLLNEKTGIEKKQQKKAAFFFLFWKVDHLYQKRLKDFELPGHRDLSFDSLLNPSAVVPAINPSISLLGKFPGFAVASILTATAIVSITFWQRNKDEKIISEKVNNSKIYPGDTATISKIDILLSENKILNKKTGDMKNLKAIGALLLTGTSLAMPVNAQVAPKAEKKTATQIEIKPKVSSTIRVDDKTTVNAVSNVDVNVNADVNSKIKVHSNVDVMGTFFGEKLRWSAENNELYFEGKSVINFGKNNFVCNGSNSFLGKVYYLVIDGKPILLEEKTRKDIRLSEKKYNLVQLSPGSALKKYGEEGKNGAVEISFAE